MKLIPVILLLVGSITMNAQNRAELEKRRNNTLKEISETENIISTIKQSKTESIERLNLLNKKISLRNKLIGNLTNEITEAESKVGELGKQTESLSEDIRNIKIEYGRMIYLAYLNRGENNQLMFILASKDFNQAYKRVKYLKQYSDFRQKQIAIINGFQKSLGDQIVELQAKKLEMVTLLKSKETENANLKSEMDEKTKLVSSLKTKEHSLRKKLQVQNEMAVQLQDEIERIIKAEIKAKADAAAARVAAAAAAMAKAKAKAIAVKAPKANKANKTVGAKSVATVTPAPVNSPVYSDDEGKLTSNFRENKGKFIWPTERGVITRPFGEYRDPVYKELKHPNNGVDISTVPGSEARSVFNGEVSGIYNFAGTNYMVLINHGKYFTLYQNLVHVSVKRGDIVHTKQSIGKIFTDESSQSTVLHIEFWEGMNKLDPEIWLSRN
jgi:murein hydrolase activator